MNDYNLNLTEEEENLKNAIIEIVEKYLYSDFGKSEIEVSREIYKQVRETYDI